ncbi:MAG: hypothetical protein LC674_03050, partial [Actinobacteria bacterium]|nr:hypothetical protein [Actinomycetota bacterium]
LAKPPAAITAKIRKLVQLTRALERGEDFMVTRLTTIKSLCTDEQAATQFLKEPKLSPILVSNILPIR